jgi:hypothetical protein
MKLGEAELQELQGELDDMAGAGAILDWDTDAMQRKMREMEAELQSEMDDIERMMGGMSIQDTEASSISASEMQEEELMEQFAKDEIAEDDIDIDETDSEDETDDLDVGDDLAELGVEDL